MSNTYYKYAENDYYALIKLSELNVKSNMICSMAQKTIERYLKHIIDEYVKLNPNSLEEYVNKENVLKTHNLRYLLDFINEQRPDIKIDRRTVLLADGFYFSVSYPGDNSFMVSEEDIEDAIEALIYTKKVVDNYIHKKKGQENDFGR